MNHGVPALSACTCGYPSGRSNLAEHVDPVAGAQRHDGSLDALALAVAEPGALALTLPVERVDVGDLDVEHLLDRDLDLGLVGQRVDVERVLVLVQQAVTLLRDHRSEQHVTRVVEHQLPASSFFARCDGGSWKPASSAASALRNQTSATVRL